MLGSMFSLSVLSAVATLIVIAGGMMNLLRQDPNEIAEGAQKWRRKAAQWTCPGFVDG
jgi:hypothetical protein